MSVRVLAATAAFLLVLCAVAGALLVHRLGYWEEPATEDWVFENSTLDYARGQRVVLRPIIEGAPALRYTFLVAMGEPLPEDQVFPLPHLRAGLEEFEDGQWYYRTGGGVEPVVLCQMGALTPQEWLVEIRPIREVSAGGAERTLLQARYGHQNGASVFYYRDPERPVPILGWERSEMVTEGRAPEIHFASDGGRVELTGSK